MSFVRAMHLSRDSTSKYVDNLERQQEIAIRKAEMELELLRAEIDQKQKITVLETLRTLIAKEDVIDRDLLEHVMANVTRELIVEVREQSPLQGVTRTVSQQKLEASGEPED